MINTCVKFYPCRSYSAETIFSVTDRWTDSHGETIIPPPPKFRWQGGVGGKKEQR